ncbi:MAG: DUF438 domain-containing protein [Candidatus Marinimicrobia bacterium]|nr:DUF438 domain-containing protein [Candidatus Neomarinimicrobiota bacterium]
MSDLKQKAREQKNLLKHMILQLHEGVAPEQVKKRLAELMGKVPYEYVVEVEQELIAEGLPQAEILKLCDIHVMAMEGQIDTSGEQIAPAGHPVHTFKQENQALTWVISDIEKLYKVVLETRNSDDVPDYLFKLRTQFNSLSDVEKHYRRKENLLFPFLEEHEITGPPTVMWGKHDETRAYLKNAHEALKKVGPDNLLGLQSVIKLVLKTASKAVSDMIYKEEEILFPMSLDTLTDADWYQIYQQSVEIGFCLFDPATEWQPENVTAADLPAPDLSTIRLPSGSLAVPELLAILNTIPFDVTFVDKNDTVRYFSQGRERIFERNRAIIGRKVQFCHPPKSVHIVEQILADFKAGKETHAQFWLTLNERFLCIEYYALRDEKNEYLGVLEVSQDLTDKRALQGEQRLLNYVKEGK